MIDKQGRDLLKKIGYTQKDIKLSEMYDKFSEKLGDVLKIKDIPNIKDGETIAYVYKNTTYDKFNGLTYGIVEIGIDEDDQNGEGGNR